MFSKLLKVKNIPFNQIHCMILFQLFIFETASNAIVDLGFLIDGSESIEMYGQGNFKRCLDFVKKMVAAFSIGEKKTHVGIVVFSSNPELQFDFKKYYDLGSINLAIDSINYPNQGTLTGKALTFTKSELFTKSARPGTPHLLLVMTDGASSDPVSEPAKSLQDSGVIVYSIGIGRNFELQQLQEMASDPDSDHVFTADFSQLDSLVGQIKQQACKGNK